MINIYGAVGEMRIGRGNRSTQRNHTPLPLCPPKVPHDLTCEMPYIASGVLRYGNSIDWAKMIRFSPQDGGGVKSPKSLFELNKIRRWIMSKKTIVAFFVGYFTTLSVGSVVQ
jgi:hypothetical protein